MGAAVAALIALAIGGCGAATETATDAPSGQRPAATSTKAPSSKAPETTKPSRTKAQEQAVGAAEDYLNYTAFSRSGLIDQLVYEGYSKKDATYAADHVEVNWNKQAAAKAKDYLDYDHFSRSGLIDQLEYEGFTHEQAVYGVGKAGL